MPLRLKRFLLSKYGGFGDRRVKDITRDLPFKIDDQSENDSQQQFCAIFVRVTGSDRFVLSLSNNAPINPDIATLVESQGGEARTIARYSHIEVELSVGDVGFIRELSSMIRGLVGAGRHHENRDWKWLCPRTADSLDNFANLLSRYPEVE